MSTWAITCDLPRLRPEPDGGRYVGRGDERRGKESRGDLAGYRSAQLELPVSGERGPDEPVRDRAPRLGRDPRPAHRARREPRHRQLPDHLLARPGGRGDRGGRGPRHPARGRRAERAAEREAVDPAAVIVAAV